MADTEPQAPKPEKQPPANGLLDRTTALVKKFNLYLATLATMAGSWYALHKAAEVPDKYIYLLVSVPFLILILFEVLPSWYKKHLKEKLEDEAVKPVSKAGYFRLFPYQEIDQADFKRADNAQEKVLQWILSATSPLLYLSGRSGTGKSSLLASWVLPKLQQQNYKVLSLRAYHDPLIALQQQLCAKGVIWQNGREATEEVTDLLHKACDKLQNQTLLLVFDQFEELTIIQDVEIQQRFAAFLQGLIAQPIKNLKLLAVLRSDYLGKLDDLALPPIRQQENWQEIAPFDYAAAKKFFNDSGLNLSTALLDKVLAEAGEIEENPGLLRPITLNMLGVVLQRFGGGSLQGTEPGKLIRNYLREAVTESEVREFAPLLLRQMVSDAGTKIALSESALGSQTRLDKGTVRGCLVRLGSRGLVREVDAKLRVWEVSHDFIARLLGQLVAGLLPSWWKRSSKIFAYSGLMIWLMAIVVGYPAYQDWDYGRGRALLANYGIEYSPQKDNPQFFEVIIKNKNFERIPNDIWNALEKNGKEIVSLKIYDNNNLTKLLSLNKLIALQKLAINSNDNLNQLPILNGLTNLQFLEISDNENLNELPDLNGLINLRSLEISFNRKLIRLPDFNGLRALQSLKIYGHDNLIDLSTLNNLIALQSLDISSNKTLKKLPALNKLTNLKTLNISYNDKLEELPDIKSLIALQSLEVFGNDSLPQLPSLNNLVSLQLLNIYGNDNLNNLPDLSNLINLQALQISDNTNLNELPDLSKLKNLIIVVLLSYKNLNDLQLHNLTNLKKLILDEGNSNEKFVEWLTQQRQQQGLNSVEIESTYYLTLNLKEELEKLKQP